MVNFYYVLNLGFDFVVMHRYTSEYGRIIEEVCGLFHNRDEAVKVAEGLFAGMVG